MSEHLPLLTSQILYLTKPETYLKLSVLDFGEPSFLLLDLSWLFPNDFFVFHVSKWCFKVFWTSVFRKQ